MDIDACLLFEHYFGLDVSLAFECSYRWEDFLYFQDLLSWDWFPVIYFDVSIDFLDDGLLKLSHVGCLHGFMLVEVVLVVACSKRYGI